MSTAEAHHGHVVAFVIHFAFVIEVGEIFYATPRKADHLTWKKT